MNNKLISKTVGIAILLCGIHAKAALSKEFTNLPKQISCNDGRLFTVEFAENGIATATLDYEVNPGDPFQWILNPSRYTLRADQTRENYYYFTADLPQNDPFSNVSCYAARVYF